MEVSGARKRLGLDTNVLLDLGAGRDFAHDFRLSFQQAGYGLFASPTVFRELGFGFQEADLRSVYPVHPKRLLKALR